MLRVRVLGQLAAELDGRQVPPPVSRRAWALLGFLALYPGSHPRGEVAARFWPDVLDHSARASMRSALWSLRRALGPGCGALIATRDQLGLDTGAGLWVDMAAFDAAVAAGRPEQAVAVCGGDLLAGIDDDWAIEARDAHAARLGTQLRTLSDRAAVAGDHEQAVGWARQALAAESFSEDALRLLMRRLAERGNRVGALAAYERFRERLSHELRTLPSALTRRLADELRRGDVEPVGDASADPARTVEAARRLRHADESAAVAALVRAAGDARAMGSLDAAAGYLEEASALRPDDSELGLTRAEVEACAGHHQRTAELFEPVLLRLLARGDHLALAHAHLRYAEWHSGPLWMPAVAREATRRALVELELVGAGPPGDRR